MGSLETRLTRPTRRSPLTVLRLSNSSTLQRSASTGWASSASEGYTASCRNRSWVREALDHPDERSLLAVGIVEFGRVAGERGRQPAGVGCQLRRSDR